MFYQTHASCVGCGRAFVVVDVGQFEAELSPHGVRYLIGICPECEKLKEEAEAEQTEGLTEAQKRYLGKQDEDAVYRAQMRTQLEDLLNEVWREEQWDKTERHIDQAVNLTDAQERAKKRRSK